MYMNDPRFGKDSGEPPKVCFITGRLIGNRAHKTIALVDGYSCSVLVKAQHQFDKEKAIESLKKSGLPLAKSVKKEKKDDQ